MSDVSAGTRREFVKVAGSAALGASLFNVDALAQVPSKRRYAIVGTGDRGSGMWGRDLARKYPDLLEFVGLCDKNPKRAVVARDFIGAAGCPTFTNFDEMIEKAKPELLMVTTVDGFQYMKLPDSRAGAMSCLTGIAIRNSIDQNRPIRIADLVKI